MSWIRSTVQTVHFLVLLLVCSSGFYSYTVGGQHVPHPPDDSKGRTQALTITEAESNDSTVTVDTVENIDIENSEPFIPTNEWQTVKPGQAIPRGLHVRLNMKTGEREAKLLDEEEEEVTSNKAAKVKTPEGDREIAGKKYKLDEVKKAVKTMKSEKFRSKDMKTLQEENNYRSYEELKEDFEKMNAGIKTDAEIITELVEQFRSVSHTQEDVTVLLEHLEYYLHQIDNALLFNDLGALPLLLRCFNNTMDRVRSEAALALGSALQSNPKVQVSAMKNGAMNEILRLLAQDSSPVVRKRALYSLSTMIRHFPFAQKQFLELGGLNILGAIFEDMSAKGLQVKAVTLLADLVKEKNKHSEMSDLEDATQKERLRQYNEVGLQEAMQRGGWCSLIPSLLHHPEHDSREKVLVAMETMAPACRAVFQTAVPELRSLRAEYQDLVQQERLEQGDGEAEDGFYGDMVSLVDNLLDILVSREEL